MQSSASAGGSLHSPPPDAKSNESQTSHQRIFVGFGNGGRVTQIEAGYIIAVIHAFDGPRGTSVG